ncbi:hypothetical protein CK203_062183 [Vitis vinifera]|uniref:Uncharacterized protein n=1 Tax=Vitis vinifera TaxID=29760 RepID=A0A438GD36_VITVI|nr:hypothetical protein CK203_062183 [Vitis vinifera]
MSCLQRELVLLEGSFLVQSVHHEAFKSHERPTISNYYANIFTFLSKITKNLNLKIIFISMNVDKSQFIHYALDHIHVFIDGFVSFGCRGKLALKTHDSADKSLAGTLMAELTTMKLDGTCGMHEHILEMSN